MRKATVAWTMAAAALFIANAAANDLNPGAAWAAGKIWDPLKKPWDMHLKSLWGLAQENPCPSIWWVWVAYDGYAWEFDDPYEPHRYWLYQLYDLQKPDGFDEGTLNWRIWCQNGEKVTIYRWHNAVDGWEELGYYSGSPAMSVKYEGPVYASWFDVQYNPENPNDPYHLFIMALGEDTPDYIRADKLDIRWGE